jgi:tRNA (guanine37-N1)-methyltransferase
MLALKVRKENAEKAKKYLSRHKLMVINYRIMSSDKFIYFPIADWKEIDKAFLAQSGAMVVHAQFEKIAHQPSYRDTLRRTLGRGYEEASRGYDILGDIAVIDSARNRTAARKTAQAIMSMNKNVRTVLEKGGPVSGIYRTRKYGYVSGKRNYEAVYRENGAVFRFDVRNAFFSTRLAFERARVTKACGDDENVLVMFAGIGPFAIEIGKRNRKSRVLAMELNKKAFSYMLENIKLNKAENVAAECGNVKELAARHIGFADRIVMPHPTNSYSFLDCVLITAGKRCIVHYYAFGKRGSAFDYHSKMLRSYFKEHGRKFRVLFKRVVRDYSPTDVEIVIDFVIS